MYEAQPDVINGVLYLDDLRIQANFRTRTDENVTIVQEFCHL